MNAREKKAIFATALALVLVGSITANAQLTRVQSQKYALSPTMTVSVVPIDLGTLVGGASGSQTFNGVVSFAITSAGTQTVTATLDINDTSFASYQVVIENSGGQVCALVGGSAVSTTLSCTFTIPGSSNTSYNEAISYTANDGITYAGSNSLTFALA